MVAWRGGHAQTAADAQDGAVDGTELDELSLEPKPSTTRPRRLPRVNGHSVNLPPAQDLHADARRSTEQRIPILLFFDLWDCPYCDRALHEFLVPMASGEEWRARAIYRQIEIDKTDALVDFNGDTTTHRAVAERFHIKVTPTIYVVDAHGQPLGKPLVGLMTPDFYGAYLEQAINDATAKLKSAA
jgi:thioredoxin-related protein